MRHDGDSQEMAKKGGRCNLDLKRLTLKEPVPDARALSPGAFLLQLVNLAPKSGDTRRGDEYRLCARRSSISTYSDRTRRLKFAPKVPASS